MKRLFRWKDHLMVATSMDEAWLLMGRLHVDSILAGPSAVMSMDQHERETRGGLEDYDRVPAREYLHALDPEEVLEIPDYELPVGWEGGPRCGDSVMWMACTTVATWAEHLPDGWHWDMTP